jgi:hypothetical protein
MLCFCMEKESVYHFKCVVARELWKQIAMLIGIKKHVNLLAVSSLWICEKHNKFLILSMQLCYGCCEKCRNEVCFNRAVWSCMQVLHLRVAYTLVRWKPLCPEGKRSTLEEVIGALEHLAH